MGKENKAGKCCFDVTLRGLMATIFGAGLSGEEPIRIGTDNGVLRVVGASYDKAQRIVILETE